MNNFFEDSIIYNMHLVGINSVDEISKRVTDKNGFISLTLGNNDQIRVLHRSYQQHGTNTSITILEFLYPFDLIMLHNETTNTETTISMCSSENVYDALKINMLENIDAALDVILDSENNIGDNLKTTIYTCIVDELSPQQKLTIELTNYVLL